MAGGFPRGRGRAGVSGWVTWPPLTDMPPCQLHSCVPVDVGEQPQAEALRVGGVGEAVHGHGWLRGVECLPDALVELIVGDGAPEGRLAVGDGLQVCRDRPGCWVRECPQAPGSWTGSLGYSARLFPHLPEGIITSPPFSCVKLTGSSGAKPSGVGRRVPPASALFI